MTRIGPVMAEAIDLIRANDGYASSMMWLAERIGPHGSRMYGYRAVHRLLSAGIVRIDPSHPFASIYGKGSVVLVEMDGVR